MKADKDTNDPNKNDFISREAAIKTAKCHYPKANEMIAGIILVPAADVVEVVRCRDCKHRPVVTDESHPYGFGLACPKEGAYQDVTCPYLCDDGYYNRMPADGWYCADGERRADNG